MGQILGAVLIWILKKLADIAETFKPDLEQEAGDEHKL